MPSGTGSTHYPEHVPDSIQLRLLRETDIRSLAALYRAAAQITGAACYSNEQTRQWARHTENLGLFARAVSAGHTLVAEWKGTLAAFGQLNPPDHIAYLYTDPEFSRKGCASALCDALERKSWDRGLRHVRTEATRLSRGLFEKKGFQVQESEHVLLEEGVLFERFRMLKRVASPP